MVHHKPMYTSQILPRRGQNAPNLSFNSGKGQIDRNPTSLPIKPLRAFKKKVISYMDR